MRYLMLFFMRPFRTWLQRRELQRLRIIESAERTRLTNLRNSY
jgi:hypothetical protein